MSTPIKLKDPGSQGRTYTYSFTFGGLATLVASMALALTLFFVLGVLVGRGHRPEAALPPVARIMPTEPPAQKDAGEILRPEELQFREHLEAKGTEPTPAKPIDKVEHKPKAPEKKEDKKEEKKAEAKPAEKGKDDKKAADHKAAEKLADQKADKKAEAKPEQKADGDTKRYAYVYQAGSFPDPEQAKAFLKKVKSTGLKAEIETGTADGKTWYRVVCPFQGTPVETRGLKEKLKGIGVKQVVMRSKKPL